MHLFFPLARTNVATSSTRCSILCRLGGSQHRSSSDQNGVARSSFVKPVVGRLTSSFACYFVPQFIIVMDRESVMRFCLLYLRPIAIYPYLRI